jgi:ABC-2 type transport system ATP-binding protein
MVQRLGIAQAMLHDPELVILDEPTDGLDPGGRAEVRQLLRRLGDAGKTVFLNSHILQEVELVCDRVAVLVQGKIRASGTLTEIAEGLAGGERVSIIVESDDVELLRRVLGLPDAHPINVTNHRQSRLDLPLQDQRQVDYSVDCLRNAGLSLIGLQRVRPSLEDIFLTVVGPEPRHDLKLVPSAPGD